MVVLCDGMLRSGSTWSFNVALRLLRSCDPNRKTFGIFSESPAVLAAAVMPRYSHLVIKSHALDASTHELCRTGAVKTIYTWRDPHDVVISCLRMFGYSVEHSIGLIQNALRTWSFHRATNSAFIVSYDTIMSRPSAGIAGIADFLGLTIEPEILSQIGEELSFENMKRFSQHIV